MPARQPGAPVTRVALDTGQLELDTWPATLPVVAHLLEHGLDLDPGITILIGQNGSGKSTLVEALAAAWARRITTFKQDWMLRAISTPSEEDSSLHRALRLDFTRGGPTGGLFLRAERFHSQAPGFSAPGRWSDRLGGEQVLARSHGEGFLQVLAGMVAEPGLYFLDEPESALSFDSCLMLITLLIDMRRAGSQVVMATHSPLLAATPGATLLHLDDTGIHQVAYDDTDLVISWRSFLAAPQSYLRHLT